MVVAQPNRTITAPRAVSKTMTSHCDVSSGSKRGSLRVRGQDWLGRVRTQEGSLAPGTVLLEQYINPLELVGTRLSLFAQMYDKYRFNRLRFEFVPCASTTIRGAIILAYDRDISDSTPPANDAGIRQYMAMQDAKAGPLWAPLVCDCPLSHPEEGLFTNPVAGGDDRLSYQGQFYVALLEPTETGVSVGDVYVHYDIELFDPQLDTQAPQMAGSAAPGDAYFGPAVNDALRSFVTSTNVNPLSDLLLKPKLDAATGKAFLDLAQGVYKVFASTPANKLGAGAISYTAPTVVPNVDRPAAAPQPGIVNASQADAYPNPLLSTDPTPAAWSDFTVAVPPGGAKVYLQYDDVTGFDAAGLGTQILKVDQLSKFWANPASIL